MRRILIATLALSPVLLHAQAIVPAQPQTSGSAFALQSKLIASATPDEVAATNSTTVPSKRVSTGVIAPKLIHSVAVPSTPNTQWERAGRYRSAIVDLVVDQDGKPTNLKLVKSAGEDLDKSLLESVSQYRFQPGTVSSMPIPTNVTLTVNIQNPVR